MVGLVVWIGVKSEQGPNQDSTKLKEKTVDKVIEAMSEEIKSLKNQVIYLNLESVTIF